ncbi:hypothetical protein RRG08_053474 [Elysia crispata]|uniref:Uncharacterized protein n=1 Tax=Elysia crispata TaxID=231223 RepID=A0AAE1A222_9GAST|nr:hypothetical protein RRG08_053474 [Elysia crispata]
MNSPSPVEGRTSRSTPLRTFSPQQVLVEVFPPLGLRKNSRSKTATAAARQQQPQQDSNSRSKTATAAARQQQPQQDSNRRRRGRACIIDRSTTRDNTHRFCLTPGIKITLESRILKGKLSLPFGFVYKASGIRVVTTSLLEKIEGSIRKLKRKLWGEEQLAINPAALDNRDHNNNYLHRAPLQRRFKSDVCPEIVVRNLLVRSTEQLGLGTLRRWRFQSLRRFAIFSTSPPFGVSVLVWIF